MKTIELYKPLTLCKESANDISYFLSKTYEICMQFREAEDYLLPSIYELVDTLSDVIFESNISLFSFRGMNLSKFEIMNNFYFIQFLFEDFEFAYRDFKDEIKNDCQNILLVRMVL